VKKIYISIEESAALMPHSGSDFYYIRHIFNALRENKELLDDPDYKRLYDEAIDYLFRHAVIYNGWDADKREWDYGWLEFISYLETTYSESEAHKYSVETVNAFLEERRKIWNT